MKGIDQAFRPGHALQAESAATAKKRGNEGALRV